MTTARQQGPIGRDTCICEPDLFRATTPLVCRGPAASAAKRQERIVVDVKFRKKTWRQLPLDRAIALVYSVIDAEKRACYHLVYVINQDQWYVSYIAELLGGAEPPSQQEWSTALLEAIYAGDALKKGDTGAARRHLLKAVRLYNAASEKWVKYKGDVGTGAERGKLAIEISIVVLSTMVTAGVGGAIRATGLRGLAAKGGLSAGTTAYTTTATEIGKVAMGVEKEIDLVKIVGDTLTAFVTSIAGGALADKFLSTFPDRFWLNVLKNPQLVAAYKSANVMLPKVSAVKVFLIDMLKSSSFNVAGSVVNSAAQNAVKQAKGKKMTMKAFLTLVANECGKQGLADILAKHVALTVRGR